MNELQLIKDAYDHIDTYGMVYPGSDSRWKRQQDLLDRLRDAINSPRFTPRPPDILKVRLTLIDRDDIYEVALVSDHDDRMCALSCGLNFDRAHFELSNWTTYFRDRNCQVEVVDSANVYGVEYED